MILGMPAQPNAISMCPPGPAGTHSVVSWLMLVKEELLKELILLLLKSLERSKNVRVCKERRPRPWGLPASPLPPTPPFPGREGKTPCWVTMWEHTGFAVDY